METEGGNSNAGLNEGLRVLDKPYIVDKPARKPPTTPIIHVQRCTRRTPSKFPGWAASHSSLKVRKGINSATGHITLARGIRCRII